MAETLKDKIVDDFESADDSFLSYLLAKKQTVNIDKIRLNTIRESLSHNGSAELDANGDMFRSLEFEMRKRSHIFLQTSNEQYRQLQEQMKKRRYSVDFDSPPEEIENIPETSMEESVEEDDLTELRKRLLTKSAGSETGGNDNIDKQLQEHDNIQSDLMNDMVKLVSNLKDGAVAFQNALEEDEKILNAAEIGIHVASNGIKDMSGRLQKYDKKKLSLWFYLCSMIFMVLGLIVTFVIVRLFPAL
ncbi:hypothetical protein KAFR_0A04400 [Kazachstania africana CBS 2517]|uniref:Uncharacterized protein n=1 Tax=Kazachstania africana (strain ATCC 22294 / BCRC 22015 / CBS 2517 / CECT 1963 / NBRC 1671 / NRRL Y-8276) TaxID=1071382 RepID=H2ANC5_KAZAF|nr:hypothetical protein KAFR_0A04400 [Kazachstania africana CBS 2517]CCF55875.1 hypothetical protein KAFR_0A04400 [Kazachstania africana CBS 2517]